MTGYYCPTGSGSNTQYRTSIGRSERGTPFSSANPAVAIPHAHTLATILQLARAAPPATPAPAVFALRACLFFKNGCLGYHDSH